ncbi:MAG: SRPBCC family protein [Anaeromyxobacteraceae bacterium]
MTELDVSGWVPFPLPEVLAFFSDPRNLPRIMPAELDARIVSISRVPPAPPGDPAAAGPGTEIALTFRPAPPLPFRARWRARIVAFEPGVAFEDEQAEGPFAAWRHRHEFRAERRTVEGRAIDGTVVRDLVRFEVGFRPLGALAARLVVGPRMRAAFRHRQRALPGLLEAARRFSAP